MFHSASPQGKLRDLEQTKLTVSLVASYHECLVIFINLLEDIANKAHNKLAQATFENQFEMALLTVLTSLR